LRSIEQNLGKLREARIHAVAISVDSPETSRNLAADQGYTFPILSDPEAEVTGRYDLVHVGGGISGENIARPAELLIDTSGTVRWLNLTENYWVRARPEQILEAAQSLE
jgi:peroxiredoxin